MNNTQAIVARVAEFYTWIDQEIRDHDTVTGSCLTCGQCCDFQAYDHRLFVTTPELIFFKAQLAEPVKPMSTGRCPYQEHKKCSVHAVRFFGCRIFCCKGQAQFQNDLMEVALQRIKAVCEEFDIPYEYVDLPTALNQDTA